MYRRCIAVDVNICKHCEYFRSQTVRVSVCSRVQFSHGCGVEAVFQCVTVIWWPEASARGQQVKQMKSRGERVLQDAGCSAALLRHLNKTSREGSGPPVILLCPVHCWASSEPHRDAACSRWSRDRRTPAASPAGCFSWGSSGRRGAAFILRTWKQGHKLAFSIHSILSTSHTSGVFIL